MWRYWRARQDKLEALAEELRAKGIDALPVGCDVTDEASIEKAVKTVIEHFGRHRHPASITPGSPSAAELKR